MVIDWIRVFLLTHLIIFLFFALVILFKRSTLSPANLLPILLIPVFGPLSGIAAELTNRFAIRDAEKIAGFFQATGENTYWKTLREPETAENVVPLEEALIINDRMTRKQLVFETLLEDPLKNINILLLARENNDVDTAHYANTTIAKIQRDFQLQIQRLSVAAEKEPYNLLILGQYISALSKFIDSGLSEAFLLRKQRITLEELLDRKLEIAGFDEQSLNLKIINCIELGDLNEAEKANRILQENKPLDENTWLNALRISVASRDPLRLAQTLEEIKAKPVVWTAAGKELSAPWLGESHG